MIKNIISVLFVLLFFINGSAQKDTLVINGFKFVTVIKTEKNEFNVKDTLLKLYRVEDGKAKYLLTHYLYRFGADCNNEFTDIGTYEIQNDSIIFLTAFLQKTGIDPIPDFRKQIYKVGAGGKLALVYDKEQERYLGKWVDTNNK